ncbi:MAG: hypothetical protein MJZ98_01205 [Paludibacteraceae bacterium]|nr:hypothetical protein [Paludibacteraceae bacterium]
MDTPQKITDITDIDSDTPLLNNLKILDTMTYDIFSYQAPKMPKPTNSTNFVKLVLSHTSQSMREPLLPMIFLQFLLFCETLKNREDGTKHPKLCGQKSNLFVNLSVGKA